MECVTFIKRRAFFSIDIAVSTIRHLEGNVNLDKGFLKNIHFSYFAVLGVSKTMLILKIWKLQYLIIYVSDQFTPQNPLWFLICTGIYFRTQVYLMHVYWDMAFFLFPKSIFFGTLSNLMSLLWCLWFNTQI